MGYFNWVGAACARTARHFWLNDCVGGDDGTLQVVAAGGTGAFEYAIDGGPFGAADTFTGLEAGTHTVTVRDDNDCETDLDVVIGESDAIVVDDVVVAETCLGDCTGSIALDASEGIAPYTYSIDGCATTSLTGDFTDLCAGDYDICVVDVNGKRFLFYNGNQNGKTGFGVAVLGDKQ